uniref:Uncharacterized protein n=1 Tax=Physcomitrium patens TaxID=3218 RepID=A0A2K1JIA4_PHYPA|nr:hypothetical protein PHYPA_018695 [Physcomitrium patens]
MLLKLLASKHFDAAFTRTDAENRSFFDTKVGFEGSDRKSCIQLHGLSSDFPVKLFCGSQLEKKCIIPKYIYVSSSRGWKC